MPFVVNWARNALLVDQPRRLYTMFVEAALDGDNEIPSEAGFCYDNARDAYGPGGKEDGDMEELIRIMEERE